MNATKKNLVPFAFLAALAAAPAASAQVIVNEQFNYADQAALDVNWNLSTNNVLTLNPGNGTATIGGTGTNPNIWNGTSFSLTPSDQNPIRFSADIFAPGNVGSVGTVGLRTGANPLFEMGLYRSFDNSQTGPDSTAILSPAGNGIGVRTIAIGIDLNGQDWVKMSNYFNGSARFEATFSSSNVTTRVDLDIDGTWDLTYTEVGTNQIAAFTDLRVHSPVTSTTGAGGITVDNIVLEVIPEPSTYALIGIGALAVLANTLRRRSAQA